MSNRIEAALKLHEDSVKGDREARKEYLKEAAAWDKAHPSLGPEPNPPSGYSNNEDYCIFMLVWQWSDDTQALCGDANCKHMASRAYGISC